MLAKGSFLTLISLRVGYVDFAFFLRVSHEQQEFLFLLFPESSVDNLTCLFKGIANSHSILENQLVECLGENDSSGVLNGLLSVDTDDVLGTHADEELPLVLGVAVEQRNEFKLALCIFDDLLKLISRQQKGLTFLLN